MPGRGTSMLCRLTRLVVASVALVVVSAGAAAATVITLDHAADRGFHPSLTLHGSNPAQQTLAQINLFMRGSPDHLWVHIDWTWSCTDSMGNTTAGEGHRKGNNFWNHRLPFALVAVGATCTADALVEAHGHINDPHVVKIIRAWLNLKTI